MVGCTAIGALQQPFVRRDIDKLTGRIVLFDNLDLPSSGHEGKANQLRRVSEVVSHFSPFDRQDGARDDRKTASGLVFPRGGCTNDGVQHAGGARPGTPID